MPKLRGGGAANGWWCESREAEGAGMGVIFTSWRVGMGVGGRMEDGGGGLTSPCPGPMLLLASSTTSGQRDLSRTDCQSAVTRWESSLRQLPSRGLKFNAAIKLNALVLRRLMNMNGHINRQKSSEMGGDSERVGWGGWRWRHQDMPATRYSLQCFIATKTKLSATAQPVLVPDEYRTTSSED